MNFELSFTNIEVEIHAGCFFEANVDQNQLHGVHAQVYHSSGE
ncbi:MAG: hypothetical protein NZM26_04920 [Patescibacteria group bacterium]|nr:hypothetical protein [Patescibacteria group bacterium]